MLRQEEEEEERVVVWLSVALFSWLLSIFMSTQPERAFLPIGQRCEVLF